TRAAIAECAAACGGPFHGGVLRLRGDVPIGLGMGSSTTDVVAAVRAVESSYGVALGPDALARIAVTCEQASDPLMFGTGPLLFAQRQGAVLETFHGAWPSVFVVGCRTGGGAAVDTLSLPADAYRPEDVHAYEWLRRLTRRAVAEEDAALLGRVCTASARLNQRVLVKPELGELLRIADATGAVGVQVAHSGNVTGLLYAVDGVSPHRLRQRLRRCVAALRSNGMPVTRIFTTRPTPEGKYGPAHHRRSRPSGPGAGGRGSFLSAVREHEGRLGAGGRGVPAGQQDRPAR
ncbi:GHMP family kinase ATP-binding protein, partial [Saccharomonospora halophila]|uniref:GHMP family kinase ATP-binding protein n=1 Tax=Saccharomonospora halophila TaxID=129922 RepID=UPI000366D949